MHAPAQPPLEVLSGWAGFPQVETCLIPLHRLEKLRSMPGPRAIRGNGRSYGDAAVLAGGPTFSTLPQNRFLEFDRGLGLVRAEPGVTISEILDVIVPAGWVLPVVPGTRHATLGGCIAADVHGKNHPISGSFAHHLVSVALIGGDGKKRTVSPESSPKIFWATCGGMGLTGYVREATIRLQRIETALLVSLSEPCADLDQSLAALASKPLEYPHAAVWIDGFAQGPQLGRGIVSRARHARASEVASRKAAKPWRRQTSVAVDVPKPMRWNLLPMAALKAFNAVHRTAQSCKHRAVQMGMSSCFFPLDAIGHWNRLYGERGFIQYQIALPERFAAEVFRDLLERLQAISSPPFLVVLKRLGEFSGGPLSFPQPGFTLALDLPRTSPALPRVLDEFDERVASLGGRVYLAKDSRMKAHVFRAMYPRLDEWRKIKAQIDPENRFQTELGRRLGLCA
jgi:decaprenylphospho-beta-D-ribofuranose 2-oxidase